MEETVYAYLCNRNKCKYCSFPTCSHTLNAHYRVSENIDTEMRLVGVHDGIEYYMEFVKNPGFVISDDHDVSGLLGDY